MKTITPGTPGSLWLKATVIASFWAAFEIVAGSFLHNLRIPMSGTILSLTGVILVVSFVSGWKQHGLVWRAGLICALLKSVSPSAVILGPMIGIFSEALLMELFIFILGNNLAGYMAGGAMAVFSALLHKAVSLLILYGFNLVAILEALYKFSVKQVGLEQLPATTLVAVIAAIYLLAGMLAAFIGYLVGKRSSRALQAAGGIPEFLLDHTGKFNKTEAGESYSSWLLLLNIAAVVGILALVNSGKMAFALLLAALYLAFVALRYRNALRRLSKPGFWIQFIIITLIASLLLESLTKGVLFSRHGLMVGLNMNFRAVIVVMGFAAISTELRNPVIRALSSRGGLSALYQSVNLAFSALPEAIRAFPGIRPFFTKPLTTFAGIVPLSEAMIRAFDRELSGRNPVIIITGDHQEGKTTFAGRLVDDLEANGIPVTGFLAKGVHDASGRIGFDLQPLREGDSIPLCRLTAGRAGSSYHRFTFFEDALREGNRILDPAGLVAARVVVVDEVGPMEMKNSGWAHAIRLLCRQQGVIQVWIARRSLVEQAVANWSVKEAFVFDVASDSVESATGKIISLLD